MKLKPLADRIVIKRVEEERQTASGLYIPESATEKPARGKVTAVGPGALRRGERVALEIEVGNEVMFGKYAGNEVEIDGVEYVILRENEVLGVVD